MDQGGVKRLVFSSHEALFSAATVSFAQTMLDFANIFVIPFVLYVLAVKLFSHERLFGQFALVLMAAAAYLCVIGICEYWTWQDQRTVDDGKMTPGADPVQPGNPDLHRVQQAYWGKLGYEPVP